jgi:uncharacterized membrane protein YqaE (UPF0057 family)
LVLDVTKWVILRQISTSIKNPTTMSFIRVLLAIIFPPLSVIGKGCGSFLIVLLLTFCGWVPGVIAALVILNNPN